MRSSGEIMWKGERVFVTEALIGELVGIAELETGDHVVRFCNRDIGLIDRRGQFRRFAPPRFGSTTDTGSLLQPPHPARSTAWTAWTRLISEVGVGRSTSSPLREPDADLAFKPRASKRSRPN